MIVSLTGTVERRAPGEVVVHVGGVGYGVAVSLATFAELPGADPECRLRVVTVVREEEISLYGFASAEEEALFRLLVGVNGVGPKLALKILSGMRAEALRQALVTGDAVGLTAISGVGKKLAQRLVVELKDKAGGVGRSDLTGVPGAAGSGPDADAVAALEVLGYPRRAAEQALAAARVAGADDVQGLVREALKQLAPRR
ncbi:MAG: Holliday junction branch migration protein RuvA [Deferrisomatales bacterium]|nr:Holliday junction branch migration protein RuvA [Deferrisomatales bacterium]